MDLYAIHKTFSDMQQQFGSSSDRSDAQDSRNREEMARLNKLINMAIFNGNNFDNTLLYLFDLHCLHKLRRDYSNHR